MAKYCNMTGFNKKIKDALALKQNVMQPAFRYFKSITPIRNGYARQHTTLSNDEIDANYPYAQVLDSGRRMTSKGMRGSNQAPEGMSGPTAKYIVTLVNQYVNKIGKKK